MNRRSTCLLLAVLALTVSGCVVDRTVATTIHNPLETGQIDDNTIPHQYANQERNYALPAGSLNDEATLTRLDAEAICMRVTLRAITGQNGETWSDLRHWNPALALAPGDTTLDGPTIELVPDTAQQYQGRVPQRRQTGSRRVCTQTNSRHQCVRTEVRPVYQTVWVPGTVTVMVTGSVYVDCDSTTASSHICSNARLAICTAAASLSGADCGTSFPVWHEDPDNTTTLNQEHLITVVRTIPVAAAGAVTFYINGQGPEVGRVIRISSGSINVVFTGGPALTLSPAS